MQLLKKNREVGSENTCFVPSVPSQPVNPYPNVSVSGMPGEIASAIRFFEGTHREFASFMNDQCYDYPIDPMGFRGVYGNGVTRNGYGGNGYGGSNSLDVMKLQAIPKEKGDRIKRSFFWAEQDDFLSAVIGVKEDFTIMGFDLRVRPEEASNVDEILSTRKSKAAEPDDPTGLPPDPNEFPDLSDAEAARLQERGEFQLFLSQFARGWDMESIVRDLMHDWFVSESMILYWRIDTQTVEGRVSSDGVPPQEGTTEELSPGLEEVMALCPKDCEWDASTRPDRLFYRIPDAQYKKIQAAIALRDPTQRQEAIDYLVEEQNIPLRWIAAVVAGKRVVELLNEEGDYWIVLTRGRKHWGLSDPTMATIFPYLEIRKALREGDFATAYMMKHFIFHITMGESIPTGPLAGQRSNWATPEDTKKLYDVVTRTTKTARLVTNHTVKFSWIFPPKEMWDNAKYDKAEFSILNWSGVTRVIMTGEGTTGSSGYISTKRLVATMIYARRRISYILGQFFSQGTVKQRLKKKVPKDMLVTAAFDENALKEFKQILDEIRFMTGEGMIDPVTSTKELSRDPDAIRANKLLAIADNEATGAYKPLNPQGFGFGQGGSFGNQGGRPPNPGTTQDADTQNQPKVLK